MGKAHERNRMKRRMREALRRHVNLLPAGCDLIFHPRRTVLTLDFKKLEAEVVRILQQATRCGAQNLAISPATGKGQARIMTCAESEPMQNRANPPETTLASLCVTRILLAMLASYATGSLRRFIR